VKKSFESKKKVKFEITQSFALAVRPELDDESEPERDRDLDRDGDFEYERSRLRPMTQ